MATKKFDSRGILKQAVLFAMAAMPLSAYCGNTAGTVTQILTGPTNTNLVFVTTTGTNTALPACSTAGNLDVIDLTSNAGKAAYAAILSAKLTNSTVTMIGTGTCTLDTTSETVSLLQI